MLLLASRSCKEKCLSYTEATKWYREEHLFWKGSAKDASGTNNCTNSSSNDVSFISDFFEEINPNYTAEHRWSCCQYWKGHVFTKDLVGIEPTKKRNTPCDPSTSTWQDSALKKLRWILKMRSKRGHLGSFLTYMCIDRVYDEINQMWSKYSCEMWKCSVQVAIKIIFFDWECDREEVCAV